MKKNKLLAFVLSLFLTVGLLPSLSANAAVKDNNTIKVESKVDKSNKDNSTLNSDSVMTTNGVKGKIAKATLKAAAYTLRSSGLKTTLKGLKYVGFSTATINNIVKYSDEIAYVLEDLATWSTVVKETIADQVLTALTNIGA